MNRGSAKTAPSHDDLNDDTRHSASNEGRNQVWPLRTMMDVAKDWRETRRLSVSIIGFLIYNIIYISMVLSQQNIDARYMLERLVDAAILDSKTSTSQISFEDISSIDDVWEWQDEVLVPVAFANVWYNGDVMDKDTKGMIGLHTRVAGGVRMIQKRMVLASTGSCFASSFESGDGDELPCYGDTNDEPDARFGETDEAKAHEAFQHKTDENGDGGYHLFLIGGNSTSMVMARQHVAELKRLRWIDKQTRSITMDLLLYNNNLKEWALVNLQLHFELSGLVRPVHVVQAVPMVVYEENAPNYTIRVVLDTMYGITVMVLLVKEFYTLLIRHRCDVRQYIRGQVLPSCAIHQLSLIVNVLILSCWMEFVYSPTRLTLMQRKPFQKFVNISSLVQWEHRYLGLHVINVLIQTFRSLVFFQVFRGGKLLLGAIRRAIPDVASFLPIYIFVMTGFTLSGHLLFGVRLDDWSSFDKAFFRVYEVCSSASW